MFECSKGRYYVLLVRRQALGNCLLFKRLTTKMRNDPVLLPLSPSTDIHRAKSNENWCLEAEGNGYLYYFFDQSLVGSSFGSLQATDILSNPSDEGKLDSLAHGIASGESDKAKQSNVIWRDRAIGVK